MLLENFQKTFDARKVMRLLGAKDGRRISSAAQRRVESLTHAAKSMIKPQLSYRILDLVAVHSRSILLSDGARFTSSKIARAMARAQRVCCFMATVGPAVDLKVKRFMGQQRYADAYVLDAMGSMSAENVVEQFYQRVAKRQAEKNGSVTLRFSPGYCDWPIYQQRELFALFDETETPDVSLSEKCLMTPRKSITGLFGLLPEGVNGADPAYNPCNHCNKRDCIARRGH